MSKHKLDGNKNISTTWVITKSNLLIHVKQFCLKNNLTIANIDTNSIIHLKVFGNAKFYEAALNIEFHEYIVDDYVYYDILGDPVLPKEWNNSVTILGLDTKQINKPHVKRLINKTKSIGAFTPIQLSKLYNFPTNLNGNGQRIGIIELGGGYVLSDIIIYFGILGINATPNITNISIDGAVNNPNGNNDDNIEVILDIEVIASLVPNAEIRVYFAPNTSQGFYNAILAAVNDNCGIISISWGSMEVDLPTNILYSFDSLFRYAKNNNVTILAASGDDGSINGIVGNNVNFPSSNPFVIACGGTTLVANNDVIISEVAWSQSGSGISQYFNIPEYQKGLPLNILNVLNGKRGSPDVCGNADPNTGYILYSASEGGNFIVGGTSCVAPLWSGLIARINQKLDFNIGFANPILYSNENMYNDITVGDNGDFNAGVGFDLVSGWGSPNGNLILDTFTIPYLTNAKFIATPTLGNIPLLVTFIDQSTNNPTSWLWDFGDGNQSTLQNPSHTYILQGLYNVTLTVTNINGDNTIIKSNYINATNPNTPVASFFGNVLSGYVNLSVTFTDTSTNIPSSWLWDFGDGNLSALQNPTNIYTIPGVYTVTLTSTNINGSNTTTKINYINALPSLLPPVAKFTSNVVKGFLPLSVTFTDESLNNPISWFWDFGDSFTSNLQNPVHIYTVAGIYNVNLTVTNMNGSNTITRYNYIIAYVELESNFIANPLINNGPSIVNFTDLSLGNPTSWVWDFGDGNQSTLQNPSHLYTVGGIYTIKLQISTINDYDTMIKEDYVIINFDKPIASFTAIPLNGNNPLAVTFTDTSLNYPTQWLWLFGDNMTSNLQNPVHNYTVAGKYIIKLIATNINGSSSMTIIKYISVV